MSKYLDDILNLPVVHDPEVQIGTERVPHDPRLFRLSYSALSVFQSCPRKFQLARLNADTSKASQEDWERSLTFAYGHAVGEGIADLIQGKSWDQVIFNMITKWGAELFDENPRQHKSLFHAIRALDVINDMLSAGFMEDYELLYIGDKPAVEISYRIELPSGFTLRGAIDLILRNKSTGQLVILEVKTSSQTYINYLTYKNSEQAIGYSAVLERIAELLGEGREINYTVEYLVYFTKMQRWENFSYPKTHTQRALWLRDRLWETDIIHNLIQSEGSYGMFPTRSSGCVSWGRACPYIDSCHTRTEGQIRPLTESGLVDHFGEPDYIFTLDELLR